MTKNIKNIAFVGFGEKNEIFDILSPLNRDNCLLPYRMLRERFRKNGFILSTIDMLSEDEIDIELHLNSHQKVTASKAYLLDLETEAIWPQNTNTKSYEKVFTFDDEKCLKKNHFKICYPNDIESFLDTTNRDRANFLCLIAGNKKTTINDERELYSERVKTIRWFEKKHLEQFSLYGMGWDGPALIKEEKNMYDKFKHRIFSSKKRGSSEPWFPSYKGKVKSKAGVLRNYKFSICYENLRDIPGYITEKIFDCFLNGCVPVYWGANNIYDYIPKGCFIDRREFKTHDDLYCFLSKMSVDEYKRYQENISEYMQSKDARVFGCSNFVDSIVGELIV